MKSLPNVEALVAGATFSFSDFIVCSRSKTTNSAIWVRNMFFVKYVRIIMGLGNCLFGVLITYLGAQSSRHEDWILVACACLPKPRRGSYEALRPVANGQQTPSDKQPLEGIGGHL